MSNNQVKKAWYQKPENFLVYGGLAFGGWMALKALDTILPLLIRVAENGLYASFLIGSLAVVGFLAVNGDFHRLAWYGYKSAMRWLTGRFIELDPIGIMRTYVSTLKDKQAQIKKSLAALKGQAMSLTKQIEDTAEEHANSMKMAAQAKARLSAGQSNMRTEMQLQARKAGRAEESAITYQGLLNKIRGHIALIEKIDEASQFMILDLEDTISQESKKRELIHASAKAMSAAKRILAADQQREMYDMALEATTRDYFAKLGEISQFVEDSEHFINTMDLQNGAFEADALAKLEEWEKRSASLLEGGTGSTTYRVAPAALTSGTEEFVVEAAPHEHQFAELFGKLDK